MFPSPSSWPHASCPRPEPALPSPVPEGQGPGDTSPHAEIRGGAEPRPPPRGRQPSRWWALSTLRDVGEEAAATGWGEGGGKNKIKQEIFLFICVF